MTVVKRPEELLTATSKHDYPYAQIVVDRGQSHLDKELTYLIPEELRESLRIGSAVLVPVGRQKLTGYVTGFAETCDFDPSRVKPIQQLISKAPLFDSKALKVARWLSAYYHCPLSDCIGCFVPHGWQLGAQQRYGVTGDGVHLVEKLAPRLQAVLQVLQEHESALTRQDILKELNLPKARMSAVSDALNKLVEQGLVHSEEELLDPAMKPRRVQAALPTESGRVALEAAEFKRAPKQRAALERLAELARDEIPVAVNVLTSEHGMEYAALNALKKKGFVEYRTIEQARAPVGQLPPRDAHRVQLTDEQQNAVTTIVTALEDARTEAKTPRAVLVQGVTASGKTEVYLSAIEHCLSLGRRALVLVPEIALTAQTVEIFQRRFQERVAILHSALGAGERFDEWRRARAGRADIVVGARSAVFAPCRDLGLIIIDEEHDHSYKQDSLPRYHARDVAARRADLDGAVLVLGSATPSLESYQRAMKGDYTRVLMTHRIGNSKLPPVEIVDMTQEARMGSLPVLSHRLQEAICHSVSRGEQVILFLNRRGFATYVQCLSCGHVEECPNCSVTLTFHRHAQSLRCHHCGHEAPAPEICSNCNGWMIGFTGTGTEKVQSEVEELLARRGFGEVKILRLDRDTTARKGAHGKILGEFRQGKAQVLIGTQMVTKGLDFPHVTLVGVIVADAALNMPDFRAAERTFQLLSQVAGRAGRGDKPGLVLVQSLATDHYAIQTACAHDFEQFVQQEIESRQHPAYPPFSYIVNIVSSDENVAMAKSRIEALAIKLGDEIDHLGGGTEILGPVDCPLARVKNRFRFHLMLRDRNRPRLHRVLEVFDQLSRAESEGLTIDVDPMSIL